MNELIRVEERDGRKVVSARELHEGLQIKKKFTDWMKQMIEYGFDESVDYVEISVGNVSSQKRERTYSQIDYVISLDMAKEISMIQRNEIGKQFRQYFIECEKQLSLQPRLTKEQKLALVLFEGGIDAIEAHKQLVEPLVEKITVLEPKADYHDKVLNAGSYLTITEIAKDLGMTENRLNKILCEIKIQYKKGKKYALYAEYDGKGYVDYKTSLPDDRGMTHIRMCWTETGRKFIIDKLEKLELC